MSATRTRRVRRPVAAGSFYPGDADELAGVVDDLLAAAATEDVRAAALVVPHAGYIYSGPVAASAYATLRTIASSISKVVILGPAHFVLQRGTAVPGVDAWTTPLGEVAIDAELRENALACGAAVDDAPHAPEHSLEVQLPFLQRLLGPELGVLPIAVGMTSPTEVADLIEAFWGRPRTLVVISTDLSHYHEQETARRLDRRTADAVLARDPSSIGPEDACGAYALRGLAEHARQNDLEVRLLDLRTSGDTAGDPSSVVGYGAFALGTAGPG